MMTFVTILMMTISVFALGLHILICPAFPFGKWFANEMDTTLDTVMYYTLTGMIAPYVFLGCIGIFSTIIFGG